MFSHHGLLLDASARRIIRTSDYLWCFNGEMSQELRIGFCQLSVFLIRAFSNTFNSGFTQLHMLTEANSNHCQISLNLQEVYDGIFTLFHFRFIFYFILRAHMNTWSFHFRKSEFNMNSSVDLSLKKALKTPPTRRTAEVKTPTEILYRSRHDWKKHFIMSIT